MEPVRSALARFTPIEAQYKAAEQSNLLEREIRYGAIDAINITQFTRLRRFLTDSNIPFTTSFSHDYRAQLDSKTAIRHLTYFDKSSGGEPRSVWQTKRFLQKVDVPEYNMRLVFNEEKDVEPVADFDKKQSKQRMRDRISYTYSNMAKIDLTELTTTDLKTQSPTHSYEVEIEYLPSTYNDSEIKEFSILAARIFTVLYDTHLLYTSDQKRELDDYIERVLNLQGIPLSRTLSRARNLKLRDMVWGGLIGGKTEYRATIKTDGTRKLLIIDDKAQLWLAYPPMEYNLILSNPNLNSLAGTILDGESVELAQRINQAPKNKYWFLIFDALCFKGNRGIQQEPHNRRIEISSRLSTLGKDDPNFRIKIGSKDFYDFTVGGNKEATGLTDEKGAPMDAIASVDRFYYVMNVIAKLRKDGHAEYKNSLQMELRYLNYKDDGIVFIPRNTAYDPGSNNINLHERVLTKYPDLCKWKPAELITNDLLVKRNGDYLELYAAGDKPFLGTPRHPYRGRIEVSKYPLLKDLNNVIVEFAWSQADSDLKATRVRWADKPRPNPLIIAQDNWDLIFNPITEETLCGKNFVLLRRYHNRIKRELLSSVSGNLLDIGSGRGGDIDKWGNFKKVIAVEPNAENRAEFEKRLSESRSSDKVKLLTVGGEDTSSITTAVQSVMGSSVDVISLMLSMSFFWKDALTLQSLINTITRNLKDGGDIVFLTINGNVVKKTMVGESKALPSVLQLGPAVLTYRGGGSKKLGERLHIDIKDTIVSNQDEYLVHLSLFYKLLGVPKEFITTHKANEEKFLSKDERIFSALFTYGRIHYKNAVPTALALTESKTVPAKALIIERKNSMPEEDISPLAPGLVSISIIGGPDNFLHALLRAFYPPYQESRGSQGPLQRREMVKDLRRQLGSLSNTEIAKLLRLNVRFMQAGAGTSLETSATILGGINTVALLHVSPENLQVIAVDHGAGHLQTLFYP